MKRAISIDDKLLREADDTALQMGLSRSRLFAVAMAEFLRRHQEARMLVQLNELCGKGRNGNNGNNEQDGRIVKAIRRKFGSLARGPMVTGIRQGQVYWLDSGPARGSAPAERHPCVVAQHDVFNRSAIQTTVVCVITSNLSHAKAPGNVALKKGDASLNKPGVVNVSQIFTVDKTELVEYVGILSTASVTALRDGLHLLFNRL